MANDRLIRVVIIDDHLGVRAGIKNLLWLDKKILVVGEGGDGDDALRLAKKLQPEIIMLDFELPKIHGSQVLIRLQKEFPHIKVLILSSYNDGVYIQTMLENGAAGYLVKDKVPEQLTHALHHISEGG